MDVRSWEAYEWSNGEIRCLGDWRRNGMVGRQEIVFMPGLLKELELERIVARMEGSLIYIIPLGIIRYMGLLK